MRQAPEEEGRARGTTPVKRASGAGQVGCALQAGKVFIQIGAGSTHTGQVAPPAAPEHVFSSFRLLKQTGGVEKE